MSGAEPIRDLLGEEGFAALCLHEAAHAAVALALGLKVEKVSVAGTLRVDEATQSLYGLAAGSEIPVGGTLLPDELLDTRPLEVLASMAAPSFIDTGVETVDRYGALEAQGALAQAPERGVDPAEVAELARSTAAAQEGAIRKLARHLEHGGSWHPGEAGIGQP